MPTSDRADRPDALVDTSIAIALIVADHRAHASTVAAVRGKRLGLSGHAWFETYSVLTRLPPGARRSPTDVLRVLAHDFPGTRFLTERAAAGLRDELPRLGIAGGAVYDALVGATARHYGLQLISRDRRAIGIYDALGVQLVLVS